MDKLLLIVFTFCLIACDNSKKVEPNPNAVSLQKDFFPEPANKEEAGNVDDCDVTDWSYEKFVSLLTTEQSHFSIIEDADPELNSMFPGKLLYLYEGEKELGSIDDYLVYRMKHLYSQGSKLEFSSLDMEQSSYGCTHGEVLRIRGYASDAEVFKINGFSSDIFRMIPHYLVIKDGKIFAQLIDEDTVSREGLVMNLGLLRWRQDFDTTKSYMRTVLGNINVDALKITKANLSWQDFDDYFLRQVDLREETGVEPYLGSFAFFIKNEHLSGHLLLKKKHPLKPSLLFSKSVMGLVNLEYAHYKNLSTKVPVFQFGGVPPVFYNELKQKDLEKYLLSILTELKESTPNIYWNTYTSFLRVLKNSPSFKEEDFSGLYEDQKELLKKIRKIAHSAKSNFETKHIFSFEEIAEKICDMLILAFSGFEMVGNNSVENPYDFDKSKMALSVAVLSESINSKVELVGNWIFLEEEKLNSYLFYGVRSARNIVIRDNKESD